MSDEQAPTAGRQDEPVLAIIGGSGVGQAFSHEPTRVHEPETPFGRPSGPILETRIEGITTFLLARHGLGHLLNPSQVPHRANIFALKQLGATHVIASGAVGSLREEYRPRDLVIPDSVIDKTVHRAGTFYDHAAVHVEMADPFCDVLRRLLLDAAGPDPERDGRVHDGGCYVCMEGPAFGTRAESHMHRLWGGDLIGMTLMPEAKLAREAELPYAAVCLVTDYDSWRPRPEGGAGPSALLEEIIGNLKQATSRAMALIRRAATLARERNAELAAAPARDALKLAIWSDRGRIDPAEVARLRPLWGRYFPADAAQDAPAPEAASAVD